MPMNNYWWKVGLGSNWIWPWWRQSNNNYCFPLGASQWIIFVSTVNCHRTFLWVALYGLSTGSHLITEVKSYWAGSISRLVTILVSLCCMPGEVRLGLCSTLVPPTSGSVCVLSWGFFSGYSGFPPLQNWLPVKKTSGLGAVLLDHHQLYHHLATAIVVPFTCIWPILLSCALRNAAPGLQARMISRH